MGKMIEENHQRALLEYQKNWNKQRRKEKILTLFIGAFLITVTILLLNSYNDSQKRAIDNCVGKGNTQELCVRKLG